jgi:hypothetical protein
MKPADQTEIQIKRYVFDRMNEAERHAFEREMQADPFLAEAVEGYLSVESGAAIHDIGLLKTKVTKPKPKRRVLWLAAASVVLLLISTTILFNSRDQVINNKLVSEVKMKEKSESFIETSKIATPDEKKITSPATEVIQLNQKQDKIVKPIEKTPEGILEPHEDTEIKMEESDVITVESFSNIPKSSEKLMRSDPVSDNTMAYPVVVFSQEENKQPENINTEVLKINDTTIENERILEYVAQVKSTPTVSNTRIRNAAIINREAEPIGGSQSYNEYLKLKLSNPSIGKPDKKTVVEISFKVTEQGVLDSLQIIKGKDTGYADEAIQILLNGPKWQPEIKNGVPVASIEKLKLVFNH